MPTIIENGVERVLIPTSTQILRDEEDDAQALQSQLMAAIHQEDFVDDKSSASPALDDELSDALQTALPEHENEMELEQTQDINTRAMQDNAMISRPSTPSERIASAVEEEEDVTSEDHSDSDESVVDDYEMEEDLDEINVEAELRDREEDDEYESAASNAEDGDDGDDGEDETIDVETEQTGKAEVENLDTSDADSDSDDDIDPCMFCNDKALAIDTEKNDLSCVVCRKPAHHACARAKDVITDDVKSWMCPKCSTDRPSYSPKETVNKPRHSAPRLVRDLLPVSRGVQKPGAHSIFAQPLITDDEGGRALRKRKSPSTERPLRTEKQRKKPKVVTKRDAVEEESVAHSTRRSSQKLSLTLPPVKPARILQHRPFHKPPPHKFILAFRLDQSKIENILSEPPRPNRRRERKRKQKILAPPAYQPPVPKFPPLPTHHLIFPSMFGDRENEINSKPYGGILSEAEAETSRSLPQMRDREIFEIARKEAEEERKKTSAKAEAEINGLNGDGANATNSKRTVSGPPSKIKCIQFGKYIIDTSYAAPYPEEYSHESRLFICEFCLKYLPSEFVAWRHKLKCPAKHPPGDEIYRDGSLSVWEVDGRKKTEYCQCLCLMAKLFLGSKTLYYDVDPFLFYVLTEYDELGYHFVGYFSKEKRPASQNNVSCILVMPIHQRKGYATFLIEFSYLLTRIEGKEGSPEKPLSDMGLTAYRSYWDLTMAKHLLAIGEDAFSIKDIMARTGMTADDVVHSLERLYAFIKDPVTKTYAIRYNKKLYQDIVEKYESKKFRAIRPEKLVWTPYIMGRSDAAILDAQPIQTVAQREEEIEEQTTETGAEQLSPKATEVVARESPPAPLIDPALLNEHGNIAPGPPPVEMMNGYLTASVEPKPEQALTNGNTDKGKNPENLAGYALAYRVEKIPPTRFAIDPPIPAYLLRNPKNRRKSGAGTPQANGTTGGVAKTLLATRSSPRKAASVNGSIRDRGDSRLTSPDKGSISVRRSGRRSGLINEVITSSESEAEDEEGVIQDEDDEDDDVDEGARKQRTRSTTGRETADGSEEASDSEDVTSDRSEGSLEGEDAESDEEEDQEESDASDDSDAEVDEDEEDESNEEGEEEEDEVDADIASTGSSRAASEEKAEGSNKKKWQPSKMTLYRYRSRGLITDAEFREQLESLKKS